MRTTNPTQIRPYSAVLVLRELAVMLRAAERGDLNGMKRLLTQEDSPIGSDYYRQPMEAVLLEALLVIESIHRGTGRSMAAYCQKLADNHARDTVLAASGIRIPRV